MDREIHKLIRKENKRQKHTLELIASENFVSKDIKKVVGSNLTNKYAEGYPNKRYYGGCEYIDKIEQLAIDRACKLFDCNYANVQPHSGSQANAIAYRALELFLTDKNGIFKRDKLGDKKPRKRKMKILTMDLNSGSHLTHGSSVSFSSNLYDFRFFKLGKDGRLDYDIIRKEALKFKPDVILSGYSAYPYEIDFGKFRYIANEVGAMLMVDMAHIAGLVATGEHMSPIPYADIVTSTTHKTLRGPRGGLILWNAEYLEPLVNKACFPYYQGGPLEHVIAGKAVCFKEAMSDEFKEYIQNVVYNTTAFSNKMIQLGAECTMSDNHLTLLNTKKSFGITGLDAQQLLEDIGITTNKNMLPNDDEKPSVTSGLRIGFAAVTTRGMNINNTIKLAHIVYDYLSTPDKTNKVKKYYRKLVNKIIRTLK